MEFIYADTLKEKFDVLGHFYDLRIGRELFKCRSSLEIVSKQNREAPNETADAVVIMMNPGSSVPRDKNYSPVRFSIDEVFSSNWEKEIVPTRPDNAQYQIMRLMILNDWSRVKVLNLSDLRNGNSGKFSKEFERAGAIDSSNPHCITHENRRVELKNSLKTKSNGYALASWGSVEVLKESALKMVACRSALLGLKINGPWYKYASPYRKAQKLDWLMRMDAMVKKNSSCANVRP